MGNILIFAGAEYENINDHILTTTEKRKESRKVPDKYLTLLSVERRDLGLLRNQFSCNEMSLSLSIPQEAIRYFM